MSRNQPGPSGRDALLVWLKFIGLLGVIFLFGLFVFAIRRALQR